MNNGLKAVLTVVTGVLLLFLFRVLYVNFVVNEVTEIVRDSNRQLLQSNQDRLQRHRDERAARVLQKQRAELAKERKLALEESKARVKAAAWARFYKKPEHCLSFKSEAHMVECGNIRIRARREFNKKWEQGTLQN